MYAYLKFAIHNSQFAIFIYLLASCTFQKPNTKLTEGAWVGALTLNNENPQNPVILPFNFEVKKENDTYAITIINAEERIEIKEVFITGDSVTIKMPVFDSEFKLQSVDGMLKGNWINHSRKEKNVIPFMAYPGLQQRFNTQNKISANFIGNWEVKFSPDTKEMYPAKGIFKQEGQKLTGTFLTETGDYRYLDGSVDSNRMYLSCFDGSHAFLFMATMENDSTLKGDFWSGMHHHEPWIAKKNDAFELKHPDSLTYLNPGYDKIEFTFADIEGNNVSLGDERFKNKAVIVQIMGSWCPNCMDETQYLAKLYEQNKSKGLEVIAIAFEKEKDVNKARNNIKRLKERFDANYTFLLTEKTGKDAAAAALPMLNHVMSFPTTIFIDKTGKVKKIHTGYYGPATGEYHQKFVNDTQALLSEMLK